MTTVSTDIVRLAKRLAESASSDSLFDLYLICSSTQRT